jgi:CBS domain-containing protein
MKPLTAADVMQKGALTVNSDADVADAAMIMLRNKISGLPVIDHNHILVGIITESDLLRRVEIGTERRRAHWLEVLLGPGHEAAEYTATHAREVSNVMTERVITVAANAPLADVVALMEQHRIKRVPVLMGDALIGIVSRADLLRALVDAFPKDAAKAADDVQIRASILKALDREEWWPRATINVGVENGVVELTGCITDDRERTALMALAENVPGVAKVVDHIGWVEPLSGLVTGSKNTDRSSDGDAGNGNPGYTLIR